MKEMKQQRVTVRMNKEREMKGKKENEKKKKDDEKITRMKMIKKKHENKFLKNAQLESIKKSKKNEKRN